MINGEIALAPRLDENFDIVSAAQEILTRENLRKAAGAMIDFAADYLTQFDSMNRQLTTLSLDDKAGETYNPQELDALTSTNLSMINLSADWRPEEAMQKATVAQQIEHERHGRMVHFLLEQDKKKTKKSDFSLAA